MSSPFSGSRRATSKARGASTSNRSRQFAVWLRANPGSRLAAAGLARRLIAVGNLYFAEGRTAAGAAAFAEASTSIRKAAASDESSAFLQRELDTALIALGDAYLARGAPSEARGPFAEVLTRVRRRLAQDPACPIAPGSSNCWCG